MVVAGYMAKHQSGGAQTSGSPGGLGGLLGGVFGGGRQQAANVADDDDLGGLLPRGQSNPLDDILGRLGR